MIESSLFAALAHRFGAAPSGPESDADIPALWQALAERGSCRAFQLQPPAFATLETLAALALCAPTKSDLQQRDIVIVTDVAQLQRLKALFADQSWTAGAPALVVFCGNHARQRALHAARGHAFANDHLDAFFNASVDAAIALTAFVLAAEAAGLGCCPISAIRNDAEAAAEILSLPDLVFPVAALAVGHPAKTAEPSLRLPLEATVHRDRFVPAQAETVEHYDRRRAALQPYQAQRRPGLFGTAAAYTWSEDKARQYSLPERTGFGAYVRRIGFSLD